MRATEEDVNQLRHAEDRGVRETRRQTERHRIGRRTRKFNRCRE